MKFNFNMMIDENTNGNKTGKIAHIFIFTQNFYYF